MLHPLNSESADITFSEKDRISQEFWYLDIVSDKNILYRDDDLSIIIPVNKRFGVSRAFIPPFVQRIDPYIKSNTEDLNFPKAIISEIPCGILSVSHKLIHNPKFIKETLRKNYYLALNKNYEELSKAYHKGHKLNLKHAVEYNICISDNVDEFTRHYIKFHNKAIPAKYSQEKMISTLISNCLIKQHGIIYEARDHKNTLLACAFFTIYKNRIVYLISSSSPEGKANYCMHAIIDAIIQKYCNSNYILDFEGSMIPGIAYFMKGFGAAEELYYHYNWSGHWLCQLEEKIRKGFRGLGG